MKICQLRETTYNKGVTLSSEDLNLIDGQGLVVDSIDLNDGEGMLIDLEGVVRVAGLEARQLELAVRQGAASTNHVDESESVSGRIVSSIRSRSGRRGVLLVLLNRDDSERSCQTLSTPAQAVDQCRIRTAVYE